MNQVPVDVQNVALPPLQPPMQPPRPPTPVMAPTNSILVPDFSTNPQVNQLLGPKSSIVPGQLHMSMPHVPQLLNPSQSNIPHRTQVPIAHSPHNVPPTLKPLVNPAPVFPPQQLFNFSASHDSVAHSSERNNLPTHPTHSTTKHCPFASSLPGTVSYRSENSTELYS